MSELAIDKAIETLNDFISNPDDYFVDKYPHTPLKFYDSVQCAIDNLQQPQLNEKQQKYLELLQQAYEKFGNVYNGIFFSLVDYEKRYDFTNDEFFQVLEVFSKWVKEQEGD